MPSYLLRFAFRSSPVLLCHALTFTDRAKMVLDHLHQYQDVMRAQQLDDRIDLTSHYSYREQRELDAFARCMSVQHPCTAVIKYVERGTKKYTFEISFNYNPGQGRPDYIRFSEDQINVYCDQFLHKLPKVEDAVVHVLKHSTLRLLGIKHTPPLLRECNHDPRVAKFKDQYKGFKDLLHDTTTRDVNSIFSKYLKLFQDFHDLQQGEVFQHTSKNHYHNNLQRTLIDDFEDLFTVLQDVTKLSTTLQPLSFISPIKLLPNPGKLHCEVRALQRQEELQRDHSKSVVDYIGISKLSCFLCELAVEQTPHRGKHGLFYWYDITSHILSSPELSAKLVKKMQDFIAANPDIFDIAGIKSVNDFIEASATQMRMLKFSATSSVRQTAQLSEDIAMEQNIPLPIPLHQSLYEFKEEIGLSGAFQDSNGLD